MYILVGFLVINVLCLTFCFSYEIYLYFLWFEGQNFIYPGSWCRIGLLLVSKFPLVAVLIVEDTFSVGPFPLYIDS